MFKLCSTLLFRDLSNIPEEKNKWENVPVLTMETYGAESFNASFQSKKLETLDDIKSIAKSLGARRVAKEALANSKNHPGKVHSKVCHDTETIKGNYAYLMETLYGKISQDCYFL